MGMLFSIAQHARHSLLCCRYLCPSLLLLAQLQSQNIYHCLPFNRLQQCLLFWVTIIIQQPQTDCQKWQERYSFPLHHFGADVGITVWLYSAAAAVYNSALDLQAKGLQQFLTTMPILQPVMLLLLARMSIPTKQLNNPLQWQQMQMRRLRLGTELLQLLPQQLKVRCKPALRCFGPAGFGVGVSNKILYRHNIGGCYSEHGLGTLLVDVCSTA